MRAEDVDIVIVPGWTGSSPDHWQSRWEARIKSARRAPIADYDRPDRAAWVGALASAVASASRPVVFVAHSLGCLAVSHLANEVAPDGVVGAMLVAPPDLEDEGAIARFLETAGPDVAAPRGFLPKPATLLPFPSIVVASRNDPYAAFPRAEAMAEDWGASFFDAGDAGHICAADGYGPWPEGAMRLASFIKSL